MRLIFLMMLGIIAILFCISIAMYYFLNSGFKKISRQFFVGEVALIKNSLNANAENDQEILWKLDGNHYQYLVKITTSNGQLVKSAPKIDEFIPPSVWPSATAGKKSFHVNRIKIKDNTYALMSTIVTTKKSQSFVVNVAYNMSNVAEILEDLWDDLFIIYAIGLVAAILISFFLIKIGLNPLSSFVERIEQIETNTLEPLDIYPTLSELEPLIEAFNTLLSRIRQSYQRLSEFSSNIAHELRTPINNLMMETEVLLSLPTLSEAAIKEHVSSRLEEYQRLSRIIEKLLFLARADAKKIILNKASLDLVEEIKATVDFHQALADEKNIHIQVAGEGTIEADQTLFRHALTNLLTNAIKYSPEDREILIKITRSSDQVIISVIDNGVGVSIEQLPRLADRFYRVDQHRATISGGCGLGLAIVQSIMQAHGGMLEIQHNMPQGMIASLVF